MVWVGYFRWYSIFRCYDMTKMEPLFRKYHHRHIKVFNRESTVLSRDSRFSNFNISCMKWFHNVNPLSSNPTKWSNTLKQFVVNGLKRYVCFHFDEHKQCITSFRRGDDPWWRLEDLFFKAVAFTQRQKRLGFKDRWESFVSFFFFWDFLAIDQYEFFLYKTNFYDRMSLKNPKTLRKY